ncbi:hypothetical protein ZWY2020_025052 [Hordeum vulgare]|nr:hypothetical protein ZWY2020_025052 [Hordeum vulgare]
MKPVVAAMERGCSSVGAVMKLGRSCHGFVGAVDVALELRRGFNGARLELRWSFIGPVGTALELRRGCNGAWSKRRCCVEAQSKLQWSFASAALELYLRRRCSVAASSRRWCCHEAFC